MIKTGRYGKVSYDPTGAGGATLVEVISLNAWTLSTKTDKEDVSCYSDPNRVYVPGLKDVSGTLGGFWNSEETTLFDAADAPTPGMLELIPNHTEPTFKWSGLAYLDAEISSSLSAPTISGEWSAAGPWTGPVTGP